MTDTINITKQTDGGDRLYVEGELLQFNGWTFSATVKPEPDYDSMCWACDLGRVVEVSLFENGKLFASCPGKCPMLGEDHIAMFAQIDRHFPPSLEERKKTPGYRAFLVRGTADVIYTFILQRFPGVDDELIREACEYLARE